MIKKTIIISTLILAGCASSNVAIDPSKFQDYASNDNFELRSELKYTETRGMGVTWEQGLKPGRYTSRYQDENGYYFIGPTAALCQGNPKCKGFNQEGGIWVSKKSPNDVRVFMIQNFTDADKERNKQFGLLINALSNADDGSYYVFDKNSKFSNKLLKTRANINNANKALKQDK